MRVFDDRGDWLTRAYALAHLVDMGELAHLGLGHKRDNFLI
jgi:hypothetical protein